MTSEMTALIAAVVLGALFAVNYVGTGATDIASRMFQHSDYNDFSAKFVKAP